MALSSRDVSISEREGSIADAAASSSQTFIVAMADRYSTIRRGILACSGSDRAFLKKHPPKQVRRDWTWLPRMESYEVEPHEVGPHEVEPNEVEPHEADMHRRHVGVAPKSWSVTAAATGYVYARRMRLCRVQ